MIASEDEQPRATRFMRTRACPDRLGSVLAHPPASPPGLTTQVGFIRLAHSNTPELGYTRVRVVHRLREESLRRRWIAPELGLARVPQYQVPQVGYTRLVVSSPAMTGGRGFTPPGHALERISLA